MKTTISDLKNRFKSAPKGVRIISYLITAYAVYAVILGLILPLVIQSQAPKQLGELLGREVQIEKVSINPFLLRTRVNGFSIAEQNGSDSFVTLGHLELEVNFWQSVFQLAPVIDHLDLIQPAINITRLSTSDKETLFNFSSIPAHIAAQQAEQPLEDKEPPQEESSEIFPLLAHSIKVQQGRFNFKDQVTGADLGYQDIGFTLDKLNTKEFSPQANLYKVAITGADQSQLKLDGQFQLQPIEVKGQFDLSGVKLASYWPLTDNIIKARLSKGELSFKTQYQLNQDKEQFNFATEQGYFSLKELTFVHKDQPKLKAGNFELSGIEVSSTGQSVNLESAKLAGLWVDARLNNKGVDLAEFFTPKADNSTQQQATSGSTETGNTAEKPWLVNLSAFEMTGSDLNLKEQLVSQGVHWRIFPLNFSTGTVLSDLSQPIDYKLDMGISSDTTKQPEKQRGQFSSNGKLDAAKFDINGSLKLAGLDLTQFQPYLTPHVNLILNKGAVNTSGAFSANAEGKATYKGKANIDSLLVKDTLKKEPLLKWQKMSMDSINFSQTANSLKIETILLNEPYAKVLIAEDKRTNIGEISKSETETPATEVEAKEADKQKEKVVQTDTPQTETEPGMALEIGKIEIVNGSAFFADYALTPNFASGIESLEGYIKHISSTPGTTAEVDLKGKIDKYAPVSLTGKINPLIEPPFLDLDFMLDSAELTSVNPYSGTYAGYYIDKGQLSLDINYRLENNQLEGNNHILVDQLTLGKKSESDLATSLPVSLAIALLQDRNGVIDLGFEVSGDTESPEFSVGGIIAKAVVNIITKAVTAPFSLLANLVGSDEELNFIQFDPGMAALNASGENRLEKLAKALGSRPGLKISVEGSVLPADDNRAMAEMRLHQKLLQESGLTELPQDLSASQFPASGPLPAALESLFVQELQLDIAQETAKVEQKLAESAEGTEVDPNQVTTLLHIGMYNQLLNVQEITAQDLGNLAESRAQAVKAFLVENEIDPGRIFILDSRTELKKEQSQALLTLDAG